MRSESLGAALSFTLAIAGCKDTTSVDKTLKDAGSDVSTLIDKTIEDGGGSADAHTTTQKSVDAGLPENCPEIIFKARKDCNGARIGAIASTSCQAISKDVRENLADYTKCDLALQALIECPNANEGEVFFYKGEQMMRLANAEGGFANYVAHCQKEPGFGSNMGEMRSKISSVTKNAQDQGLITDDLSPEKP